MITGYEILALPMACRWGGPVVGLYIHESYADVQGSLFSPLRSINATAIAQSA